MAVTTAVLVALALEAGVPTLLVAIGAGVAVQPVLGAMAVPAWAVRERRRLGRDLPGPDDEAAFLRGLTAELAAGASPRAGLVAAADRAPRLALRPAVRLAAAGMGAERVAVALREALPVNGRLAAAAWVLAAGTGGSTTGVIQALAVRAAEEGALIRERRVLTAQARASAWVVAGLPVVLLAGMWLSGRLPVTGDPALALVLMVGLGLQAAGVAVVWWMLRRAA